MNKSKATTSKNSKQNKSSPVVRTSAPVAKGIIDRLTKPKFSVPNKNTDGRIKISHREYITDINGSILYLNSSFGINPGLPLSFPWLNTMTTGYESYKFTDLEFHFETTSPTSIAGAVIMAVDFDPSDAPPSTKTQIMAYHNAVRGPAWESFCYKCDKSDLSKFNQKFIRYGNLSTGQDSLLYDVGNLFVATTGQASSAVVGELHVKYTVELITPQLDLNAYALATSARANAVGSVTSSNWLGSSIQTSGGVPLTLSTVPYGLNILVPGQYLLSLIFFGTGMVGGAPVITSPGNTISLAAAAISATVLNFTFLAIIDVPASSMQLSGSFFTAGVATSSTLRVGYYAVSLG